jgi:hypothetical protein
MKMDMKNAVIILGLITLLIPACSNSFIRDTPAIAEVISSVTATPEPTVTLTPIPPPTLTSTFTPGPTQPLSATPTPDLAATVIALSQPRSHAAYPSPDGEWQAEVVIYECVQVNEESINAYEQLKLSRVSQGTEQVVDSQLLFCGGLGAYGLEGLFWSANNRYFYYTNAREGVPDGCGYWQRPVIRVDVTNQQVEALGRGTVSPDGTKLATWQDRELVVWDANQGEIGRATAAVQDIGPGSIVWSPDSRALVYLQVASYCPLSGKSDNRTCCSSPRCRLLAVSLGMPPTS